MSQDVKTGIAVISLSKWLKQVGVTPCTAWRWRKKGWLKTVNIAGRQYLTQESIDEFHRRAVEGGIRSGPQGSCRQERVNFHHQGRSGKHKMELDGA